MNINIIIVKTIKSSDNEPLIIWIKIEKINLILFEENVLFDILIILTFKFRNFFLKLMKKDCSVLIFLWSFSIIGISSKNSLLYFYSFDNFYLNIF